MNKADVLLLWNLIDNYVMYRIYLNAEEDAGYHSEKTLNLTRKQVEEAARKISDFLSAFER